MEISSPKRWLVVAFGFDGFCQLDVPQDDTSSQNVFTKPAMPHDISTTSPRVLMELSYLPSSVVVSSNWDALNVYVSDTKNSHSVATGRWSSSIQDAMKLLQEEDKVLELVETPKGHLILHTHEKRLIVLSNAGGSVEVEEWSSSQLVTEIGCLQDGTLFFLLSSGEVRKCFFDPPTSCKLQLGHKIPTCGHRIAHMACGADHTLLLTCNGTVLSFGLGTRGQLGHGDILPRIEPCVIHALAGLPMKAIACGNWHSLVLSQDGDVYSWGWNEHGQLGLTNSPSPTVALPTLVDIASSSATSSDVSFVSISCGSRHSAAVSEGGMLYCWGWNGYGQLGDGSLCGGDDCRVQSVYCGHWCTLCSLVKSC